MMNDSGVSWMDRIAFVLVEPQHPGNIAAVARVMAVNGLGDLRIVRQDSQYSREEVPWWLAWGAEDILERASHWEDLESCLSEQVFVVGCARRKRRKTPPNLSPKKAIRRMAESASSGGVALVFGSERTGLHAHHLELCHVRSTIPQQTDHPSYNLSHAVAIYAYELTLASSPVKNDIQRTAPSVATLQALRRHLDLVMQLCGPVPKQLSDDIFKLWLRSAPTIAEIKLLHRLLQLVGRRVVGSEKEYAEIRGRTSTETDSISATGDS